MLCVLVELDTKDTIYALNRIINVLKSVNLTKIVRIHVNKYLCILIKLVIIAMILIYAKKNVVFVKKIAKKVFLKTIKIIFAKV